MICPSCGSRMKCIKSRDSENTNEKSVNNIPYFVRSKMSIRFVHRFHRCLKCDNETDTVEIDFFDYMSIKEKSVKEFKMNVISEIMAFERKIKEIK